MADPCSYRSGGRFGVLVLAIANLGTRQVAQIGHSAFPSPRWWSDPIVLNPDTALPEISGRLFGLAVQKSTAGDRVWVVGAKGFLAYSDDNGLCWTRFDYHPERGVFREGTTSPCPKTRLGEQATATPASESPTASPKATLHWPQLVPTVFAQSSAKKPTPQPQSQNLAQQSPTQSAEQAPTQRGQTNPTTQQQKPLNQQVQQSTVQQSESKSPIWVSPKEVEFSTVTDKGLSARSPNETPGFSRIVTVSNQVGQALRVRASAVSGDTTNEFRIDTTKCDCGIGIKESCTIAVLFVPRVDGEKQAKFAIETNYSSASETILIHAVAIGFSPANSDKPPARDLPKQGTAKSHRTARALPPHPPHPGMLPDPQLSLRTCWRSTLNQREVRSFPPGD